MYCKHTFKTGGKKQHLNKPKKKWEVQYRTNKKKMIIKEVTILSSCACVFVSFFPLKRNSFVFIAVIMRSEDAVHFENLAAVETGQAVP